MERTGAKARRRLARWAASALVIALLHLAVLSVLGFSVPRSLQPSLSASPAARIELLRLARRVEAARRVVQPPSTPSPERSPAVAGERPASAAAPAATAMTTLPPQPAGDDDAAVRAMLKGTLGCNPAPGAHQTAEEKAHCAHGFIEAAKTATPFSGVDPAKTAAWDAQQAAEAARRDGAAGQAKLNAVHAQEIRGGAVDINAGVSCKAKFDATGVKPAACHAEYPTH